MLRILLIHQLNKLQIKQVCSLFSLFPSKYHFSTTSLEEPQSPVQVSSINFSGIAKSVILRCPNLLDKTDQTFEKPSLKDYLLKLSNISPQTTRRFWRVSGLTPQDVLEMLLGFESDCRKFEFEAKKIESLWGIFKWASKQSADFEHLPESYKLMASILVRVGLFGDAEHLLSQIENRGILLDSHEIFSNLIEMYVEDAELGRAMSVYDRMRALCLVPSLSCYRKFLSLLVQMNETHLAYGVFGAMVEMGLGIGTAERCIYEDVIQLLCKNGKVNEARILVKKVLTFGMEPSIVIVNAIACGYCEKKDYDDLLSLFAAWKCVPEVMIGNKIIFSLCRDFGSESANLFMKELESLGFCPDEITSGILIGWSCREGKLKNAFIYLSEILSKGLQPHICSYNALISGVFMEGMWNHAQDILHDIKDRGITPDMSTFRVLLAGYCKARQFNEVHLIVSEMVNRELIQLSPLEDPLAKALVMLGLNPASVKVRRDNNARLSNAEFFDNLGNGLYLEADLDEYERTLTTVLNRFMIPDYSFLILNDCADGNLQTAAVMVEELARWGQELTLPAFSTLVKGLFASRCSVKTVTSLLEKMLTLTKQLDQDALNLLVQALRKKGLTNKAWPIFYEMFRRHLKIENDTYTALLMGLCKKRDIKGFNDCWGIAREDKWLPKLKDGKALLVSLCQKNLPKEALELIESLLVAYPERLLDACDAFLKKSCDLGLTTTARMLVDELSKRGCILDIFVYTHLLKGFCKENNLLEAFKTLEIMLAKNLFPPVDVSVLLIPYVCKAGKFEQAVILKEISSREQPSDSISLYCALMSGLFKTRRIGEPAHLYNDMLLKGLYPDTEVYNILIRGYCQAKSLWKVRELLGVLIKKKLSISIASYRALVRLMCMEGRVPFALSIKELMLKESNPPNIVVYNILIFYLFFTGNSLFVDRLLDELQHNGLQLDGVTYNFMVHGFSRSKIVSRSLEYLTSMICKGFRPSNRNLRAVISSLCFHGEFDKALKLSREMESRGWAHCSTIQTSIVEGLLTCDKLQEALKFLERMVEKDLVPGNINYDPLVKRLCWYGRTDKAVDLLDIMLKKGNIPNPTSYDPIIQSFCRCLKFDQALDFLTEMLNRNLKPSFETWNTLIQNLCEDRKLAEAEGLLSFMVQIGDTPSREMYCTVINRYNSESNFGKASKLIEKMQQHGYELDFETHWSLISNLSNSTDKDSSNSSRHFLSKLLSDSGFS